MRQWDNELLEQLLRVQDIDLRIRGVELQIAALYDQSMRDDPHLRRLKDEAGRIEELIETASNQQEMYLTTLEDIRGAIQGLIASRTGTFKLRTRSSTEALKVEENKLTVLVGETEEQILKLREDLAEVKEAILERSREVQVAQQAPEAEIRKLRNRARRLEKQREEAVVDIPQMLLRKYERLRNSRSGIGLTIMRDGVCSVCRMQMPTGIRFRLFRGESLSACPACGRMVARIENPEATRMGLAAMENGGGEQPSGTGDGGDAAAPSDGTAASPKAAKTTAKPKPKPKAAKTTAKPKPKPKAAKTTAKPKPKPKPTKTPTKAKPKATKTPTKAKPKPTKTPAKAKPPADSKKKTASKGGRSPSGKKSTRSG